MQKYSNAVLPDRTFCDDTEMFHHLCANTESTSHMNTPIVANITEELNF